MVEILGISFLTAAAFCILMYKINLAFFAKYHIYTDIIISVSLTFLFFGTFSGVVTALVAGIFVSLFLIVVRYATRYN